MHSLQLTFMYCVLTLFSSDPTALKYNSSPSARLKCIAANPVNVVPGVTNILLQSKDGGQTWQDISNGLPKDEQPEGFFAGKSDVYLYYRDEMYHSISNLNAPDWKKENVLDRRCTSVAFNSSSIVAFNNEGQIYQRMPAKGNWLTTYTNF